MAEMCIPRRDYEKKKTMMVEKDKTRIPELERKRIAQIPLSRLAKSIILGSVLGDGSLRIDNGYQNAVFCFRHSIVQKEYFYWKAEALKEISSLNSVHLQNADGYSQNKKLIFKSRALEQLTKIYNVLKIGKKLSIKRSWLNHLTPLSLAIWWCDNGTLASSGGAFCAYGFPKEQVIILAKYLEVVWKVNARCVEVKSKIRLLESENYSKRIYYKLWLNKTEVQKLLRIILPFIPVKEMIYKTILIYKNPLFQQRWTSEIKNLINKDIVNFVDEIVDAKRSKINQKKI